MQDTNYVHLTGTVKADAEARDVRNGLRCIDFTLVVNFHNRPMYTNCTAYGEAAESLDGYVEEGERLEIEGNLTFRTFTDKFGNRTTRHIVRVERATEIGD